MPISRDVKDLWSIQTALKCVIYGQPLSSRLYDKVVLVKKV